MNGGDLFSAHVEMCAVMLPNMRSCSLPLISLATTKFHSQNCSMMMTIQHHQFMRTYAEIAHMHPWNHHHSSQTKTTPSTCRASHDPLITCGTWWSNMTVGEDCGHIDILLCKNWIVCDISDRLPPASVPVPRLRAHTGEHWLIFPPTQPSSVNTILKYSNGQELQLNII